MKLEIKEIELFRTKLVMIESRNVKMLKSFLHQHDIFVTYDDDEEIYANTIKAGFKENGRYWNAVYVILNKNNSARAITPGTLAHEAFHASNCILNYIGQEDKDNEVMAYLIDYITDVLYEFMIKTEKPE